MSPYPSPRTYKKIWEEHLKSPAVAGRMSKNREIGDFFKPYARTTIPAKRPSPSPDPSPVPSKRSSSGPDGNPVKVNSGAASRSIHKRDIKTPTTATRFRDAGPTSQRSPISFNQRVTLAVGSPRPKLAHRESFSSSSSLSTLEVTPIVARTTSFDFPSIKSPAALRNGSIPDAPASSKKVVKAGKLIAVRDSDEDDEDSNSSLDDLEDILGTRIRDTPSTSSSPPDPGIDHFRDIRAKVPRLHDRTPIIGKAAILATKTTVPKHRFNLDDILARHLDDKALENIVAKTKESYSLRQSPQSATDTDRNLLAAIAFDQDDDGAKGATRLMGAVERTEAINGDWSWSFFRTGLPQRVLNQPVEFPAEKLDQRFRDSFLIEEQLRLRTFLSGYVADSQSMVDFGDAFIKYLFDQIINEAREDLCNAYIAILQRMPQVSKKSQVTPQFIDSMFLRLGATSEALQQGVIQPSKRSQTRAEPDFQLLIRLLKALKSVVKSMSKDGIERFSELLVRLMVDETLMTEPSISNSVEDTISEIFDSLSYERSEQLSDCLYNESTTFLTDPILQKQLLSHIPPASYHLCNLRLRLAQSFLFSPSSPPEQFSVTSLLSHLTTSPMFSVLTTATSADLSSYPFPMLLAHLTFLDMTLSSTLSLPLRLSDPKEFNSQVDALADRLKVIFSNITDTGASHMTRTEAKEKLEALMMKLAFVLRTKPRPKKSYFRGEGDEDVQTGRDVMKKFLGFRKIGRGDVITRVDEAKVEEEPKSDFTTDPPSETSNVSFSSTEGAIRLQLGLGR